jgi:putative PEP-CTERM system histidine kinase
MTLFFMLPFAAALCSLGLAAVSLKQRRASPAWWFFAAGMVALGLDSAFAGLSLRAVQRGDVVAWLAPAFIVKSFVPVLWLGFALTYSRSNYREFIARWKAVLILLGLLPIAVVASLLLQETSVSGDPWWLRPGPLTTTLDAVLLVALVLILTNLEQTFRAAIGTRRWQIKFVVVGVAAIIGARLYVRTQAILYSAPDTAFWSVESSALLIGCAFLAVAYARTRLVESDVYPSLAVLRSSFTVLIVGVYLSVVGVLAQVVGRFGAAEVFQYQLLVVIVGMAGLAALLLSDRTRQRIRAFVVRHFSKAQYDSARVWTTFSRRLAAVSDEAGLAAASAKLLSETFDALSVTVWLVDAETGSLATAASTASLPGAADDAKRSSTSREISDQLHARTGPFDLEHVSEPWAEEFRRLNPATFATGGARICLPLRAGDQTKGALVLADRVNGALYTQEELELLACAGDQITSMLLNVRLAADLARAKELEAFRLMSAFFVHDLKNAAASLNLMLKNLPVHFEDPAFRGDALRTIGNTADRIDDMISRLSALRQHPDAARVDADLNQLVDEALEVTDLREIQLRKELQPLPRIVANREQIQSVVANLVLNARDAVGSGGVIHVCTQSQRTRVLLSVQDNGCGMSPTFLKESLFRPFQSTKKKGLGIGLFQSRAIIHAHGGGLHVESQEGKGTTFLVSLPVKEAP